MSRAANLNTRIGPDLRETPEAPDEMRAEAEMLISRARSAPGTLDGARDLSQAAMWLKALRELGRAEDLLREALAMMAAIDQPPARVYEWNSKVRLADVLAFRGRYEESERLFKQQIERALGQAQLERQVDFAWQHLGKCYFDQGKWDEARMAFERALELRAAKADPDLIESTELALRTVRARLADAR